jgi:nucleotide-binding universal stress UspA family protein
MEYMASEPLAFRKILLPVVGTEADEDAVKLAIYLAKKTKAEICAVYVITIKRALPLTAELEPEIQKGETVLDHIESIAEEEAYKVGTDLIQSRDAGPAIIDEAIERNVDLILIGVPFKTRLGQFSLGSVAPYVLKNAPCRVLLYRQPSA